MLVAVTVFVSVVACVTVRVTVSRMRANPWRVAGFAEEFAAVVLESTAPDTALCADDPGSTEIAVGALAQVVALVARPVAPPRRHLRVA